VLKGDIVRKLVAAMVAVVGLITAAGIYAQSQSRAAGVGAPFQIPTATDDELVSVARSKVFFAHQSVGFNILDGIGRLYAVRSLEAPSIQEGLTVAPGITHVAIGENGDPLGKIRQFDEAIRGGVGDDVDVAILKLCYIDINDGSDVDAIFAAYRDTLAGLQRDYPDVTFIAATDPVTAERRPDQKIRALLGRQDGLGPEHNQARFRLNTLLRQEYGPSGRLFDIAAVQSTRPDGQRVMGGDAESRYEAMYRGYAADPGHLNETGSTVMAEAMVATIAGALDDK